MQYPWRINDLIDLEYFLKQKFDPAPDDTSLNGISSDKVYPDKASPDGVGFDREVFLSFPDRKQWRDEPSHRRNLLRYWLKKRREYHRRSGQQAMVLPGDLFAETMRLSRLVLAVVAVAVGALLTWGLLGYQGKAPVNVFTCLWVLVVPQVILLLILGLSAVFVRTRVVRPFNPGYPVITLIIQGFIKRISRLAEGSLNAEKKNRLKEAYGLLGKTGTIYGSVFFWPVFLLAQMVGVFFNLGILGALFLRVAITDLAFGWQTTLRVSPEALLRFVEIVARPWSWLFSPPLAHPTAAQIEGTRMILKDGMVHLATGDLVAWWPFIFLSVFLYAFLPRLVLAAAGFFFYRRAVAAIDFAQGACDRLIARMTTPRLDTRAVPYRSGHGGGEVAAVQPDRHHACPEPEGRTGVMPAIALVPEEIVASINPVELEKNLYDLLGMGLLTVVPVEMDGPADSRRLRQALSDNQVQGGHYRMVVVQEAWRPPIKESLAWIKDLRAAAGGQAGLVVFLIGRPGGEAVLTPPAAMDRKVWEETVNSLGDAFVRIESFGRRIR